jgi:hypothetical protein
MVLRSKRRRTSRASRATLKNGKKKKPSKTGKRGRTSRNGTKKTKKTKKPQKSVYSKQQFSSGDGMLTSVWGPSLWHTLHMISFNYPVHPTSADKSRYKGFVCSLRHVLPCKYCRENLNNNFESLPITDEVMTNRDTFSRYIYDLHELINHMLKKKSNLSFTEVQNRYEHFRARCTTEKKDVWDMDKISKQQMDIRKQDELVKKGEKGCTEPLYSGSKSKCIIKIVPQNTTGSTFQMDKKCEKKIITG